VSLDVGRLNAVLEARGLGAADLARLTGYSVETVSAILSGKRRAPDAFAVVVKTVLNPPRRASFWRSET